MDKFTYQYERTADGKLATNKLRYVYDDVQGNSYAGDLKTGTALNLSQVQADKNTAQGSDNYGYDAIGNLIKDTKEGITNISWTVYGKIDTITKANGQTIAYTYDAGGNRISKTVSKADTTTNTWYVRDAQGNVMSIYSEKNSVLSLSEQHLYGSSRLGVWNHKVNMDEVLPTPTNASGIGIVNTTNFERGNKLFELSNHLGNVLVTVSDKKISVDENTDGVVDYYLPDITTAQDYYPFGMTMPGRRGSVSALGIWQGTGGNALPAHLSLNNRSGNTPLEYKATIDIEFVDGFESGTGDEFEAFITTGNSGGAGSGGNDVAGGYRYGFNGKENDNEVEGEGNQQDYGMRIYDPRLGRFLSVDPLAKEYAMLTPFQYASNRPIDGIDVDGLEWSSASKSLWKGIKDSYTLTKESLSASSLKKTANNIVGTVKDVGNMAMGKKGAAESFTKRVTNFSVGLSNSISEPLIFLSTMHTRSIDQNSYGIGFYGFQIGLAVLPEVWAEATSARAGMAASYEGNQIIQNALNDRVVVRFAESADDIRYMKSMNSKALYGVDMENPNGIITLQKDFGRADILEESIHHQQRKLYGDRYFQENVDLLEVQAQNKLLKIGKKENWSKAEMDKINGAKTMWEKKLKSKK